MNVSKYLFSTLFLSMIVFVSCDESEDIQRYEQEVLTTANNPLTYTNLTSYPIVGPIDSTTPNGDFDTSGSLLTSDFGNTISHSVGLIPSITGAAVV